MDIGMQDNITIESNKLKDTLSEIQQHTIRPYLIGISGGSASGKTSVAEVITSQIGIDDCILICLDSYYKVLAPEQYANISEYNFDHPNAFDFDLVYQHLKDLLDGKDINMPVYNFTISRREKFCREVKSCNLIIFEGILAFYDTRIRSLMNMMIFVDTDSDIRLARRVYRDIKERGRQLDNVIFRYHKFVKPAFEEYIRPTRKVADVIIPRGKENVIAIDLVMQHLKYQLAKLLSKKNEVNYSESNCVVTQTYEIPVPSLIIENNYGDVDGKIKLIENKSILTVLLNIFQDFMNDNTKKYGEMHLEYLVNNILSLYSKYRGNVVTKSDLIFTEIDNLVNLNVDFSKVKRIIYFKTMLLVDKDLTDLQKLIETHKNIEFHILSIYLTPKISDALFSAFPSGKNLTLFALFFSDYLIKYEKHLEKGGVGLTNLAIDEGELDTLTPFAKENFVEKFRNLWKNHLQLDNNY